MNNTVHELVEPYMSGLQDYLTGAGEAALQRAYEIGRQAIAYGLGVLDVANVHHEALVNILLRTLTPEGRARVVKAADDFFAECLAPFEMTLRGFREANARLRHLSETLEQRVAQRTAGLRESEARKAAILDSTLDCIITINHEGKVIEFNPAAEKIFGYHRDEVLGRALADCIIPPSLREQHRRGLARYLATGEGPVIGRRIEITAMRADGSEFPVELAITALQIDGQPVFTSSLRDITARKMAEGEQAAEARFLRTQTDVAQVALSSLEPGVLTPHLLEAIAHAQDYSYGFLWRVAEAAGEVVRVAGFGEGTAPFVGTTRRLSDQTSAVVRAIQTDQPIIVNRIQQGAPGMHPAGRSLGAQALLALPLVGRTGRVMGAMTFGDAHDPDRFRERDVRQGIVLAAQVAQALENSQLFTQVQRLEEQHRVVTQSLLEAVYTVDTEGRLTWANASLERLSGYRLEELLGRPWTVLFAAGAESMLARHQGEAATGAVVSPYLEGMVVRQDGQHVPVEMSTADLTPRGRVAGWVGVLRDLTEHRRAAEALRAKDEALHAMSQQLWQAAKLATMGELAASIAHELNNPLATVSLRVESLLAQVPAEDPKRRALAVVEQEVERMGALVANLLQFSRGGQQQISTLDVREEIEHTLELMQYHLRNHRITVVREFARDLPMIHADRQQLRQVFLNLLTNASDAMPQGGTLTLRAAAGGLETGAPAVVIAFVDTGVGIALEDLPKVMEPFFTTKGEGKGTGLGLAICRRIAQEHHGTFDLTSEVGKGTTVRLALPITNGTNSAYVKEK